MKNVNDQQDQNHNQQGGTPPTSEEAFQLVESLVRRYLDNYYVDRLEDVEKTSILGELEKLRTFLGVERYGDAVDRACEFFSHDHATEKSTFRYPGELWADADNDRVFYHPHLHIQ